MTEQIALLKDIRQTLSDLLYINGIIATELIKITENSAAIRHGEEFLNKSSCIDEHNKINKHIIDIVKKISGKSKEIAILEEHVLKH